MMATPNLKEFSFEELKMATENFSPDAWLADGHWCEIYKGWVDKNTLSPSTKEDGMLVVIKKIISKTEHDFERWQSEINFSGRHYHPNLIGLLGYCWENNKLHLVYEFMQKGALDEHLFKSNLYFKSDVYSFGVVLLELLMGVRVSSPKHPCGEQNLDDWLKSILSQDRKLKTIMDVQMAGRYSYEATLQAARLCLRCLDLDPQSRPSMKEVMEVLKEIEVLTSMEGVPEMEHVEALTSMTEVPEILEHIEAMEEKPKNS